MSTTAFFQAKVRKTNVVNQLDQIRGAKAKGLVVIAASWWSGHGFVFEVITYSLTLFRFQITLFVQASLLFPR